MDRRIRQVAGLLTVLFLVIAGMTGWIQGIVAEDIANRTGSNPDERAINRFRIFQECTWRRGDILSADGQVMAESVRIGEVPETGEGENIERNCAYERKYPSGDLAPHVVGQWSLHFGKTGLEAAYNDVLVGDALPPESFADVFANRPRVGNTLVSTLDTRLQNTALDALDGRRGGAVALNPKTGAVLLAASNPAYDPNPLASNTRSVAIEGRCRLGIGETFTLPSGETIDCHNPNFPLLSVALQIPNPPGSTYKVVTAAAALESGEYTPTSPRVPVTGAYRPSGAIRPIGNYGAGSCGGTLANAIRVSCNTAMAQIAVDIGADQFLTTAHAMHQGQFRGENFVGCDDTHISEVRETFTGCLPAVRVRPRPDEPPLEEPLSADAFRAQAGFGQGFVEATPFGMAVVAGTVANQGFVPSPRFADRIIDPSGALVREIRTSVGAAAMSTESATQLADMMRSVVTGGTASRALGGFRIPVAGKTGTADEPNCTADEQEVFGPRCGNLAHAWFIAFAPVDDPSIAVAVFVERGGGRSNATGGAVAAPVARTILEEYFRLYPTEAGA